MQAVINVDGDRVAYAQGRAVNGADASDINIADADDKLHALPRGSDDTTTYINRTNSSHPAVYHERLNMEASLFNYRPETGQ